MMTLTVLCALLLGLGTNLQAQAESKPSVGLSQHRYIQGENLTYIFEDTETTFEAVPQDGVLQPTALQKVQELQISFAIAINAKPGGGMRRVLQFQDGFYREGSTTTFSTASLKALAELIPKFPDHFSYEYQSDSQAISITGKAYAPYMANPIGSFVYYKALDVHTIQSVIDNIPNTLKPGELLEKSAKDIKLPAGVFHNASTAILYQRIVPCQAVRCAFFKVVTMGNNFSMPGETGGTQKLYTNYQYTFYVPLEGPKTGLLLRGELMETVTVPPKMIIQRQLSMELKTYSISR